MNRTGIYGRVDSSAKAFARVLLMPITQRIDDLGGLRGLIC